MKKLFFPLLKIMFILGCTEENKNLVPTVSKEKKLESAIQVILDIPEFQWIYHPEIPERTPVKLLVNEVINEKMSLTKFNEQVVFYKKYEVFSKSIKDYIEFIDLDYENDTLNFSFRYNIEGAVASGTLLDINNEWTVLSANIYEK